MIGRSEFFIKWALFGAATLLLFLLQGFLLQFLSIFGVMPFLYPVLTAVVGMYEGSLAGAAYGLILGVLCDLTMTGPIPCFYTLIFPLAGFCAALIAQSWLPSGFLCSLVTSAVSFILTDGFRCLLLALSGKAAWAAAAAITARETGASVLFVPVVFLLFRQIHRKCHMDD